MNIPDNNSLSPKPIDAKDGGAFYRHLAVYSYEMFRAEGQGAVLVREGSFIKHPGGRVTARLEYLRQSSIDQSPEGSLGEVPELLRSYVPERELVLLILDSSNSGTPVILRSGELGKTPVEHYRDSLDAQERN